MMVGNIFRVQGPVPHMVIYPKITTKYAKKIRKNWGMVLIVGDDVEGHLQGPGSISKYGNLSKKSQILTKKSKNNNKMVWNVRHCLQGPLQGLSQKGNIIWFDQQVKKNKIIIILLVRVHLIGC